MLWLIVLACMSDPSCEDALCDNGGDDSATDADDSGGDDSGDTGTDIVCHDRNKLQVEVPKKDPRVAHWEWSAEPRWAENGGVVPEEDSPSVTLTCPACVEGSTEYRIQVDFSDEKDRGLGFAFMMVPQVCEK